LFEEKLEHTKRHEEDKLLTKTMINNYIKDKLLMPATKKKYTREHIILMIMIYQLKNILSISDIKSLLASISQSDNVNKDNLLQMYSVYLNSKEYALEAFEKEVGEAFVYLEKQMASNAIKEKTKEDEILMAMMLIEKATYYKKLAEKMIDTSIKKDLS
jgi:hypothetical protein